MVFLCTFLLTACTSCQAFVVFPHERMKTIHPNNIHTTKATLLQKHQRHDESLALYARETNDDDDHDDDDRERVKVPRGARRRRYYEEEEEEEKEQDEYYDTTDADDRYYKDDENDYNDEDDDDELDMNFEFNPVEIDEEYEADILIPNPILDSVDPEGASERFGEIAKDPTFWRDLLLVIAVFNFCEYVAQVPYY